jgi:hypothetical protein
METRNHTLHYLTDTRQYQHRFVPVGEITACSSTQKHGLCYSMLVHLQRSQYIHVDRPNIDTLERCLNMLMCSNMDHKQHTTMKKWRPFNSNFTFFKGFKNCIIKWKKHKLPQEQFKNRIEQSYKEANSIPIAFLCISSSWHGILALEKWRGSKSPLIIS